MCAHAGGGFCRQLRTAGVFLVLFLFFLEDLGLVKPLPLTWLADKSRCISYIQKKKKMDDVRKTKTDGVRRKLFVHVCMGFTHVKALLKLNNPDKSVPFPLEINSQ